MNQPINQDPWSNAMNPQTQDVREIWGQVTVDVWFAMLVKGFGKLPYDEKTLDPEGKPYRRYTAVDMLIEPLPESGMQYKSQRQMLAEFGEWVDIVLPSLKALGIGDLQKLHGKFARVELVPTGETYIKKDTGETKALTAFNFKGVYDTRESCLAAYNSAAPAGAPTPAPAGTNGNPERETAKKFLRPYVANAMAQASGNVAKARELLAPMLATQPLLSKYFTIDSDEIIELMSPI